jgi:hypothetical protein
MLKDRIEAGDREVIGTDICIGECYANLLQGRVNLKNVDIKNPKEEFLQNANLMTIGEVVLDLGMLSLFFEHAVEIEEFSLRSVQILVEHEPVWGPDIFFGRSNISILLDRMQQGSTPEVPGEVTDVGDLQEKATRPENASYKMVIRKVDIQDIAADLNGLVASISDIAYSDFSKEVGEHFLDDVIAIILSAMLKSCKDTLLGPDTSSGDRKPSNRPRGMFQSSWTTR